MVKTPVKQIKVGTNVIIDPTVIASTFNEYFANIGPNLAKKLPQETGNPDAYRRPKTKSA